MFRWLGGAAFVGSLAYLVYFYAVTLGAADGDPARIVPNALRNLALFAVFALHHSILARPAVKRAVARAVPAHLERSLYVWVASILLVIVCAAWAPIPGVIYEAEGWARLPLHMLQAAGAVLTVGGARVIDPLDLAGIRHAATPATGSIRIVGPFRLVRHPIYLGWILLVFAAPRMTANRLLFALISSAYLVLAIPWEERALVAEHGDEYRRYQHHVRWRLVPGLW